MTEETKICNMPGWEGPDQTSGGMYRWSKSTNNTRLLIRYRPDKVTNEFVTEGIFFELDLLKGKRLMIKDNKKFGLDIQITSTGDWRTEDGDLAVTTHGPGEVIDEDVSTPKRMAAYLERLAKGQ